MAGTETRPVSRLPPKSVPLLVRSAVDVIGFLAIADPLFIFHLFCPCLTHLVSIPQLLVHYLTLCSPMFVCLFEWLFVCNTVRNCGLDLLCVFVFVNILVNYVIYSYLLSCVWLFYNSYTPALLQLLHYYRKQTSAWTTDTHQPADDMGQRILGPGESESSESEWSWSNAFHCYRSCSWCWSGALDCREVGPHNPACHAMENCLIIPVKSKFMCLCTQC